MRSQAAWRVQPDLSQPASRHHSKRLNVASRSSLRWENERRESRLISTGSADSVRALELGYPTSIGRRARGCGKASFSLKRPRLRASADSIVDQQCSSVAAMRAGTAVARKSGGAGRAQLAPFDIEATRHPLRIGNGCRAKSKRIAHAGAGVFLRIGESGNA